MIIVLGATGNIGREVSDLLVKGEQEAVFLSRDLQKAPAQFTGHSMRVADLDDPTSLERAMVGGSKLLLVSPNSEAMQQQQINAIRAASKVGIQHIVKISGTPKSVSEHSPSAVGRAHWHIEQELKAHAKTYSILQCNFFMQNLLGLQADMVRKSAKIMLPFSPSTAFRFIDTRDIAACAVHLLTDDKVESKTYKMCGSPSSFQKLADELSNLMGQQIRYKYVPMWLTKIVMLIKGMPKAHIQHQMEMAGLYRQGISDDPSDDVSLLTGRKVVLLPEFLKQHIHHFTSK
ncbi:NmrA family NAD(P)-binding protein [Shewanella profunda]|uniref:NmrA family NAD(P)-binding protein n=1 Tax=Shewanella profunda TaxID=254793 RepID=UPI00200E8C8B|nr:NmrA family NAD(P)-binding protein [Shewanella profunda]MCL1089114.1 NmrA family NAD(P)-binding protein [Shewanella profunda]